MSLPGARESQPDQAPPWVARAPPYDLRACGRQDTSPEFTRQNKKKRVRDAPVLRWERAWQEARSGQGPDRLSLLSAGRPRAYPRIPKGEDLSPGPQKAHSHAPQPVQPRFLDLSETTLSTPILHRQQMLLRTPDAHDALQAAATPCFAPLHGEKEGSA